MAKQFESIKSKGESLAGFAFLNMNNHLKLDAFIPISMPPIFDKLEQYCDLEKMRNRGTVPIMSYLDFKSTTQKAAFFHPIYSEGEITLCRSITPQKVGPDKERLLIDVMSDIKVKQDKSVGQNLGSTGQLGDIISVASARVIQVFTNPLAPPGERQVIDVPPEMKVLKEHLLEEPYPTVELLKEIPDDFQEDTSNAHVPSYSVWGLSNTDVNQHVNVNEYIMGFQNHFNRMLFQCEKPLEKHFIHRAQFIFRKPFFPGQCYAIKGEIYFKQGVSSNDEVIMLAGFYLTEKDGKLHDRPSVFTRMDSSFIL